MWLPLTSPAFLFIAPNPKSPRFYYSDPLFGFEISTSIPWRWYHRLPSTLLKPNLPREAFKKPLLPTGPFISLTTSAMHQAHSAGTRQHAFRRVEKCSHLISQHLAKYLVPEQVLIESSENKSPWMLLPTDQILAPNSCAYLLSWKMASPISYEPGFLLWLVFKWPLHRDGVQQVELSCLWCVGISTCEFSGLGHCGQWILWDTFAVLVALQL